MKLIERSYPHPVVGNRDDVPGASFQAAIAVSFDAQFVYVDLSISNGSETLQELVGTEKACYAVHIDCSNTLHRTLHRFSNDKFRLSIPKDVLNHVVEVNAFVVATASFGDYRVSGQHEDYGSHRFAISVGDILAVSSGQQFTIDRDYVSFEDVDSIVRVVPHPERGDRGMDASYEDDKIVVYLSESDFQQYAEVRNSSLAPILSSLIILPIITEAVRLLHDSPDDYQTRWSRAVREKASELGLTFEDPMECAQKLLELPIKRSLSAAVSVQDEE